MDSPSLLAALQEQADMLAATPAAALSEAVPTVPGWTVENVVRHTGRVHRSVVAALQVPAQTPLSEIGRAEALPRGAECLAAYRIAFDDMCDAFSRRDLAEPAPTMIGAGTVGWWLRRQTHEVSVHRIDVADTLRAAGGPSVPALEPEAAADGVDEWCEVFLPRLAQAGRLPQALVGRTVHLHGTDTGSAEWHLAFGPGTVTLTREHRKGDVALRGAAQDLFLALWRRRSLDRLDIVGDDSVARILVDSAAV